MRGHRAIWGIAGTAFLLALAAFFVRQGGANIETAEEERAERDRLVARMLEGLERDHRARFAATRSLVEKVAGYCDTPALASAETWYARGLRELYGDFNLQAAGDSFARSERLRPEWAWPVNGRGIVEFVGGREGEALKTFDRALMLAPGWSRPHSDLTILYRRAGNLTDALEQAQKALAMEPGDLVNQFNYGVILDDLGRHAEARGLYEKVLAAAPEMAQAAYNLACSYARENDLVQALPYLEKAIAADGAFRDDADDDPDFDPIRHSPEFGRVMSGAGPTGKVGAGRP